jgi:putative addiction module CopG family antidote
MWQENLAMESLHISLTAELAEFVERQVAVGGYESPSEYISSLVAAKRLETAHAELENLLEEGLNSPSRPLTPAVMDEIRQRMHERIQQLKGT